MTPTFRIYYADGLVVEGNSREHWLGAPDAGVQVVARFPQLDGVRWTCLGRAIRDRDLWTGTDYFDPFGFGPKEGELISDQAYFAIWERACGDS